ncbi:hypothetical protein ES705_39384 [subsurface metagenome]
MGFASLGVKEFVKLSDTPAAYAGKALKPVQVNAGVTALEFTNWRKFTGTKIFDGQTASPPTRYLKPVTMYPNINPDGSGGALQRSFATIAAGEIYTGGGRYTTLGVYNTQWWKYTIATGKWTRLANLPNNYGSSVNWRSNAGYFNGKIYLRAEYLNNDYSRKLLIYDIAGDSWTSLETWGSMSTHNYILACCTDSLYLAVDTDFRKIDYTTLAITVLTALASDPLAGGVCGDDVIAAHGNATYRYNKGTTAWDNMAQAYPNYIHGSGCFVEDGDALYYVNDDYDIFQKYTIAGGWVAQFTCGRATRMPDYLLQVSGEAKIYCYWDNPESYTATDNVACGSIHVYDPDSLNWCLLATDLVAGDFIVVDTGGVPILVEVNGMLKWTCTGLSTFFIMESGRYYFTLSKDYTMINTKIWKSVWG